VSELSPSEKAKREHLQHVQAKLDAARAALASYDESRRVFRAQLVPSRSDDYPYDDDGELLDLDGPPVAEATEEHASETEPQEHDVSWARACADRSCAASLDLDVLNGNELQEALDLLEQHDIVAFDRVREFCAAQKKTRYFGKARTDHRSRQRAAAEAEARRHESADGVSPYRLAPGGIYWNTGTKEGEIRLTNFHARVVMDITKDDGTGTLVRFFEIEAKLAGPGRVASRFTISTEEFSGMSWVILQLGAEASISPGYQLRDHARQGAVVRACRLQRLHRSAGGSPTTAYRESGPVPRVPLRSSAANALPERRRGREAPPGNAGERVAEGVGGSAYGSRSWRAALASVDADRHAGADHRSGAPQGPAVRCGAGDGRD